MEIIQTLYRLGEPVTYYPSIAKFLDSVNSAVLLQQLIQISRGGALAQFECPMDDISNRTGLSRRQIESARDILIERGYLTMTKSGMPCRCIYTLNIDKLNADLETYLNSDNFEIFEVFLLHKSDDQVAQNRQTGAAAADNKFILDLSQDHTFISNTHNALSNIRECYEDSIYSSREILLSKDTYCVLEDRDLSRDLYRSEFISNESILEERSILENNIEENNNIDHHQPPRTVSGTVESKLSKHQAELFTAFWRKYPRKVGKGKCVEIWRRLKPSMVLFDRIITGLDNWLRYWETNKTELQFIPHPATWLNQCRWEDEIGANSRQPMTNSLADLDRNGITDFRKDAQQ